MTNTSDSGIGSLRQAILNANANPGPDTIDFAPGLSGTIVLTSGELQVANDVTIVGPGANLLTIDGKNASRIFDVDDGNSHTAIVAISGLTLTRGNAGTANGGAIFNAEDLTLTNSTLSGNTATGGGGICNSGMLAMTDCTVSGNSATENTPAAASPTRDGDADQLHRGGQHGHSLGGGINNLPGDTDADQLHPFGQLGRPGGGIDSSGTATLNNTIVANSPSGGDLANSSTLSGSNNLIDDGSGGLADTIVADPLLGPLADNGGPTQTMALLPGSPAIDAGAAGPGWTTDQRGTGAGWKRRHRRRGEPGLHADRHQRHPADRPHRARRSPPRWPSRSRPTTRMTRSTAGSSRSPHQPPARRPACRRPWPRSPAGYRLGDRHAQQMRGAYTVTASASEGNSANFSLTNVLQPTFVGPNSATTTYGTPIVTFTGTLAAGTTAATGGVTVTISGNGITALSQSASLDPNGNFSATFNTAVLPANPSSPYTVTYDYAAQDNFLAATDASTTLTVNQAQLTVTADPQSKTYGGADPVLTYTVTGTFYNGDSASVISGVSLSTATGAAATAGTHPIVASGGTAANYAITDVNGTLTVAQAALTVTADPQSKTYGGADPTLTYAPSGTLYYGDTYSVISGVSLSTATGAAATAGTHPIVAGGGTAANYAITDVNGTLTVAQAALTVTADPQSKTYGGADPALTYAVSGFQLGDTAATVLSGALTHAPGETVAGSPYAISQGTLAANTNYNITCNTAQFTITPAATTTTVASLVNPSVSGQEVSFTATVGNASGTGPIPAGSVQFVVDGTNLGASVTLTGGTATSPSVALAAGGHTVQTNYSDSAGNFSTSTGTFTGGQVVNQNRTTTALTADPNPSVFGQPVTFTATVTADAPSPAVPTGTVDFLDGATNLGTGTLNNVGTATFTTSTLAPGVYHSIKAVYSGDGTNFAGSTAALEQISIIIPVAGTGKAGFSGDGGPASQAQLNQPEGVAVDTSGNLYIADTDNNRIRKISPNGIITTVAGTGKAGFSGDGGPASQAQLNQPGGVAVDASGNLYIADTRNNRIRKISPDGIIDTYAGTGKAGYNEPKGVSDGIKATDAMLNAPTGVAVDARGNLFIADTDNDRIREVRTDGKIITIAGDVGFSGDGGPAKDAQLNHPEGVAVDASGNIYIADTRNNRIRKISPNGIITTIVGNGTIAILNAPTGIAVGASGNIYIADTGNNRIRVVDPSGSITTLAVSANVLNQPAGIAVNPAGGLFISSTGNNQIFLTTETAMSPGGNALVVEGGELSLPPPSNAQPAIQLVGAQTSSLALIATLVVTSLNGGESQIMSVGSGTASVLPTQATAPSDTGGESAHAADESENPQGGLSILIPTVLRPWVLVLLGTNEALARIRGASPDLFTSGDGQQGPVALLSRAYQAVLRSIDEAIHGMVQEGHTPSLPARTEDRDLDELAGDLAQEGPARTEPGPSAVPVAAGPATDPAEVLPDTSKSTLFRLVEILAVSVASIGRSLSRAYS